MKLPQLTLRDLFWLVLVCALAVGWWIDRQDLAATNKALIEFYETPIQFDAPVTPPEPVNVIENSNARSEPLLMESELHAVERKRFEHAHGFACHIHTDSIAGQHGDIEGARALLSRRHGRRVSITVFPGIFSARNVSGARPAKPARAKRGRSKRSVMFMRTNKG